jgi:Spy/CpxP family protein refolding chaperone
MACAITAVAVAGVALRADEKRNTTESIHQMWLDATVRELGLNDKQKQEISTIQTECRNKAEPLMKQLSMLKHEEYQEMRGALTEQQLAKLPDVLRTVWDREGQRIADGLGLNKEQRERIEKIKEEHRPKFRELFSQKGEKAADRAHELKAEFLAAIGKELNDEQRVRFPSVLHHEMARMHEKAAREQCEKEVSEGLGLTAEQKEKFQKIEQQFDPKVDKVLAELKQFHQDEKGRLEKVLTPAQRMKFEELCKSRARD